MNKLTVTILLSDTVSDNSFFYSVNSFYNHIFSTLLIHCHNRIQQVTAKEEQFKYLFYTLIFNYKILQIINMRFSVLVKQFDKKPICRF